MDAPKPVTLEFDWGYGTTSLLPGKIAMHQMLSLAAGLKDFEHRQMKITVEAIGPAVMAKKGVSDESIG